MKLARYGEPAAEKPALVDADGVLRDLAPVLGDLDAEAISPAGLQRLARLDPASLARVEQPVRLAPPWAVCGKVVCVGMNYHDHAAETGTPVPAEPIVFMKAADTRVGPNDTVMLPRDSRKSDWEVELGVVIGSTARHVSPAQALAHVAGYCVVNDLSEREYQFERGGTLDKGKSCETFCPVGPWLVTADEVTQPQSLALSLDLNGQRRQRGHSSRMIFPVAHIVSYLSRFMALYPGDLISTGTPPGVGMAAKPERYLCAGDEMRLSISGLGEQRQKVVAWQEHWPR